MTKSQTLGLFLVGFFSVHFCMAQTAKEINFKIPDSMRYLVKKNDTIKTFCIGRYMLEFDPRLTAQFHSPKQGDGIYGGAKLVSKNAYDDLIVYIHEYDKPLDEEGFEAEIQRILMRSNNYKIKKLYTLSKKEKINDFTLLLSFQREHDNGISYYIRGFKYLNDKIFEFQAGPNIKTYIEEDAEKISQYLKVLKPMEEDSQEMGYCFGDVILPLTYSGKENSEILLFNNTLWDKKKEEYRWIWLEVTSYQDKELQESILKDIQGYRKNWIIHKDEQWDIGFTDKATYLITDGQHNESRYSLTLLYQGDINVRTQPALELHLAGEIDKEELAYYRELFESVKIYHRPGAFGKEK